MIYLVDTNVLVPFPDFTHPQQRMIRAAARKLRLQGHRLQVVAQNFIEYWGVATRPVARNGFGLSPAAASRMLRRLERVFPLLADSPDVYPEWRRLVISYSVSGIQVHDARLVAAMIVHGITHILTFNIADFARYAPSGIVAVNPTTV